MFDFCYKQRVENLMFLKFNRNRLKTIMSFLLLVALLNYNNYKSETNVLLMVKVLVLVIITFCTLCKKKLDNYI